MQFNVKSEQCEQPSIPATSVASMPVSPARVDAAGRAFPSKSD